MSAPIFQRTIVDGNGTIQPSASIEVRNEADSELAAVYSDRALTTVKTNPFSADANGFVEFYAPRGEYRITATFGADSIVWRYVQMLDTDFIVQLNDDGDASTIGGNLTVGGDADVGGELNVAGLTTIQEATGIGGNALVTLNDTSLTAKFSVKNSTDPATGFLVSANVNASRGADAYLLRSRGTLASPAVVQSGDKLGSLLVGGHDGTDFALGGEFCFEVDDTPGDNDMPTRAILKLTPDGSQTPAEVLRIASNGNIGVGVTPSAKLSVNGQLHGSYLDATSPVNTTSLALGTNVLTSIVVSAAITLTTTVPPAGAIGVLKIITSGATSRVVTFGSGFKATTTLATGTTSGRVFMVSFMSDGTNFYEISRTVAMVA